MQLDRTPPDRPAICIGVLLIAGVLAVVSARNEALSWNDRSRLANVECLVDHHTLAIDDSQFLDDTFDKIWVDGHFYTDKSPLPTLPMAALYQAWKWASGTTARQWPEAFCLVMTWAFSGLFYVMAVWCVFRIGRPYDVPLRFASPSPRASRRHGRSDVRPPCEQSHAAARRAAALFLQLAWLSIEGTAARWPRLAGIGALAGIAYSIDLGTGPVLCVCAGATVVWRCRRLTPAAVFVAAALPAILAHHALNYAVGGTFKPANANPEFFLYPGCPFTPETMTGNLKHSVGSFLLYAASMLFGKRASWGTTCRCS